MYIEGAEISLTQGALLIRMFPLTGGTTFKLIHYVADESHE